MSKARSVGLTPVLPDGSRVLPQAAILKFESIFGDLNGRLEGSRLTRRDH